MNNDELKLTFASLGLIYPPAPRFRGAELRKLFLAVCERHEFESFNAHGDEGATFTSEGIREVNIDRSSLDVEEYIRSDFDLVRRNIADIANLVKEHLHVQVFFAPRILLRAQWPLPDSETHAGNVLREKTSTLKDDQLTLLKIETLVGVGMRIVADRGEGNHMSLEIAPARSQGSRLFIELTNHRHDELQSTQVLEQRLREAYDYLMGPVASFVQTFMP